MKTAGAVRRRPKVSPIFLAISLAILVVALPISGAVLFPSEELWHLLVKGITMVQWFVAMLWAFPALLLK